MTKDQMKFRFKDLTKEDQELLEKVRRNAEELVEIRKEIARNFINKLEIISPMAEEKAQCEDIEALLELLTPEFKHTYGSLIYMQYLLKTTEESVVEICSQSLGQIEKNMETIKDGIKVDDIQAN